MRSSTCNIKPLINHVSVANQDWDIFCKIVDNYGDIGVCWRLSRQLAQEHHLNVRLFIDDFAVAAKLISGLQETASSQFIDGVEISHWSIANKARPAAVVLETFGCELPSPYLERMQSTQSIWINVEYLSAEPWVNDFHARPSQLPALNLTKYYFFPGFSEHTGGLLREQKLIAQRSAFTVSFEDKQAFWQSIGVNHDLLNESAYKISLFGYPEANIKDLFAYLEQAPFKTLVFLPYSSAVEGCKHYYPQHDFAIDSVFSSHQLTLQVLPFLSQLEYDRLLWACDMNFVRGEDSWIRAIWAAKPFIWQPYIQAGDTHIQKMDAFLDVYTERALAELKKTLRYTHHAWSNSKLGLIQNLSENSQEYFHAFFTSLVSMQAYAKMQSDTWASQPDLASKLVIFSEKIKQNQV